MIFRCLAPGAKIPYVNVFQKSKFASKTKVLVWATPLNRFDTPPEKRQPNRALSSCLSGKHSHLFVQCDLIWSLWIRLFGLFGIHSDATHSAECSIHSHFKGEGVKKGGKTAAERAMFVGLSTIW